MANQPPPKTVPGKMPVKVQKDAKADIAVYVEIVADDQSTDSTMSGAKTSFDIVGDLPGSLPGQTSFFSVPGYEHKNGVITKLTGLVQMKGTFVIKTVYGPSATADQLSGYGRGTTPEDEKAGNVTLGFHESCHREDFLRFLKSRALPSFAGKVGISEARYQQAVQAFQQALNAYSNSMDQDSEQRTDEVGYKRSTYLKNGPRP